MHIDGKWIKDSEGRTLILRGANLGGSSKVPRTPDGATHLREGFFDHRDVSFVGRPFPLDEADEHLARLKAWGLTFVRLQVTWEAVEHAGPGRYDRTYLDYVYEVARRAGEQGIDLFIDPHQDVWSRFSGGDGAPGWTFEAAGLDIRRFGETGAAIVHATHGDPFPRMIWPTNHGKLAAATMFTLFFAGNDFAPRTRVDGEPVQDYLQGHYLRANQALARRLKGLKNVVGYGPMNEPSLGYVGWPDLGQHGGMLLQGDSPTPLQSMALGAGLAQQVDVFGLGLTGIRRRGSRRIDPEGASAWLDGAEDIWRTHGVWELDGSGTPQLLKRHYFALRDGRPVEPNDYLAAFMVRHAQAIREVDPEALIFLEGVPTEPAPRWDPARVPNVVHAGHWYDGATLYLKRFIPFLGIDLRSRAFVLGNKAIERSFARQMGRLAHESETRMGGIPTLVGEFGIPYDMQGGRAYRTGDFGPQVQAMDRTFRALEANLLSGTVWNYTADNDNERGDQWNGEDLSIFSRDQQTDPGDIDSGGRALEAVVRPYAHRVAGEPLSMVFDLGTGLFEFSFRHDPAVQDPTEIFVPNLHYGAGCVVEVPDGEHRYDAQEQRLLYWAGGEQAEHWIRIWRYRP